MAKRAATRELNHDNWDDDEEEEEAGTFKQASSEALQGRVIKQARRRITGNDGEAKKGFSGFAGFGVRAGSESNAFTNFAVKVPNSTETFKTGNGENKPSSNTDNEAKEKEYLASLKVLNETVTAWITDHVKKNPCCVLTPIFQDYEKHLKDLEAKRTSTAPDESQAADTTKTTSAFTAGKISNEKPDDHKFQFGSKSAETSKPTFNFMSNGATPTKPPSTFSFSSSTSATSSASNFSFGIAKSDSEATTTSSTFSFKPTTAASTASPPTTAPFSFSASKPSVAAPAFSFGFASNKPTTDQKKDAEDEKGGDEEDDEDAPPKVEIKQVQEDDAFYSIRCKLFYKKDNNYTEKGVGTLHLKKIKDDKTQLVIRADTSLGNILLNIILNPQLTTQRVGKNNVMFVCIPNPPIDPKTPPAPTPMLLRVKTDTEADELLAKLNEAKK
ncbi:nuclear pore complex protein Nup50-like [Daphnia carinata]|uniref:nuclear pore complex protein Nup50-like n=1 Tax=Daphnia carinata TaxID=120202 RepID=UPI00258010BE|nr:nuclear pore complex protein Nup50-like [Daphnia carinata]